MTDRAVFDRLVFPAPLGACRDRVDDAASEMWERFSALAGLMPMLYGG